MTAKQNIHEEVLRVWPAAQRRWASSILLNEPRLDSKIEPLAYTDLETREIVVNGAQIEEGKLQPAIEAILAHEVGHHIKYPCTLSLLARLRVLERQLLPLKKYSLLNLFTDFLINEHVGRTHRGGLLAVYRTFGASKSDPPFCFYLACYEELWSLEPGSLLGEVMPWMEKTYPGYRGEAQTLASDIFNLAPNIFTQFIYFASVFSRYINLEREPESDNPLNGDCSEPGIDDYADALVPSPGEEEAVERALKEGWIPKGREKEWTKDGMSERRIASLPGTIGGSPQRLSEVMAAHYRRLASQYIVKPPPEKRFGDPIVPTTLEEWEPGEPLRDIDWNATFRQRGDQYGAAAPFRRELEESEEGVTPKPWKIRLEIYLDVSGSMPDPKTQINAMTLAAQILCLSAIRNQGQVRALIYSGNTVKSWEWVRSELVISQFLMNYIGGGTEFPFGVLAQSAKECAMEPPIRAIITDSDFDYNYAGHKKAPEIFATGCAASAPLVMLLHRPAPASVKKYASNGARVVEVHKLDDFPRLAAALADSLFGRNRRVR